MLAWEKIFKTKEQHYLFSYGNQLYILTQQRNITTITHEIYYYNQIINEIKKVTKFVVSQNVSPLFVHESKLLFISGSSSIYAYDFITDTFRKHNHDLTHTVNKPLFVVKGDYLYLFGEDISHFYQINVKDLTWENTFGMPNDDKRSNYTVTQAGEYLYLFGGKEKTDYSFKLLDDLYYFKNDKWFQLKDCPFYKIHSHAAISYEHNIYFFGGRTEDSTYNCFYKYDSLYDQWSLIDTHESSENTPPQGVNCTMVQVNGIFYLSGYSNSFSDIIFKLDLNLIRYKIYINMINLKKMVDINFQFK